VAEAAEVAAKPAAKRPPRKRTPAPKKEPAGDSPAAEKADDSAWEYTPMSEWDNR
jgi:hypothetical protein